MKKDDYWQWISLWGALDRVGTDQLRINRSPTSRRVDLIDDQPRCTQLLLLYSLNNIDVASLWSLSANCQETYLSRNSWADADGKVSQIHALSRPLKRPLHDLYLPSYITIGLCRHPHSNPAYFNLRHVCQQRLSTLKASKHARSLYKIQNLVSTFLTAESRS